MRLSHLQRTVMWIASWMMLAMVPVLLVIALWLPGMGANPPIPLTPGTDVRLPDPVSKLDHAVVLGVAGASALPTKSDLGCTLHDAYGDETRKLDKFFIHWDPMTINGVLVRPLIEADGFTRGSILRCSGPASSAAQPLYLVTGSVSPRDTLLIRALALGASLLFLILGLGAFFFFRPRARP